MIVMEFETEILPLNVGAHLRINGRGMEMKAGR
jgi:hypothetical protein